VKLVASKGGAEQFVPQIFASFASPRPAAGQRDMGAEISARSGGRPATWRIQHLSCDGTQGRLLVEAYPQ